MRHAAFRFRLRCYAMLFAPPVTPVFAMLRLFAATLAIIADAREAAVLPLIAATCRCYFSMPLRRLPFDAVSPLFSLPLILPLFRYFSPAL